MGTETTARGKAFAQAGYAAVRRGANDWRTRTGERYRTFVDRRADDRFRDAVRHARPLVYAEALVFFVLVLSLDDLRVLRVPAFLVALVGVVVILALAGLVHGARLSSRIHGLDERLQADRLARFRTTGRIALFVACLGALFWLVLFSAGVPSWSA